MRNLERFTLFSTCVCLAMMIVGLLIIASPAMVTGGLVGWLQGETYDLKKDVLGMLHLAWLVQCALTIAIGIAVVFIAGLLGILLGLGSSLYRLKSRRDTHSLKSDARSEINRS